MRSRRSTVVIISTIILLSSFLPTSAFPRLSFQRQSYKTVILYSQRDQSAESALQRTAAHLEKLRSQRTPQIDDDAPPDPLGVERERLAKEYLLRSANSLKEDLKKRKLRRNGRKPDLARRLAEHDLVTVYGYSNKESTEQDDNTEDDFEKVQWPEAGLKRTLTHFAGLSLSETAGLALGRANFESPSPIQAAAIPRLSRGESLVLHAETGSGKTLAYLLPITEKLCNDNNNQGFAVVLTPTRELAAQVAGIATVLAPPGTVRLVSHPTNLMSNGSKDRGELKNGGRLVDQPGELVPRVFVGSAKSIMHSLYGDGKMPASPTPKPQATAFLQNVRWLVLDEVDRLLAVKKSRGDKQYEKIHEKPAAITSAAVARLTLGRAQIVAASATVGRPLKRELARVLGLPAQECPPVVRGKQDDSDDETEQENAQVGRAVKIPETVENYVISVEGTSAGQLLTAAYRTIKALSTKPRRTLLVLTRGFGINTQNAIGALRHFKCKPEPQSLLDALEADGTDRMMEVHRKVSGASGVGESSYLQTSEASADDEGYLLVTGEDTVRGLHLDGLDLVIVLGRPHGPDEYTHIAGRTGRAGQTGKVINIVSNDNAAAMKSWERMLDVEFSRIELDAVEDLD